MKIIRSSRVLRLPAGRSPRSIHVGKPGIDLLYPLILLTVLSGCFSLGGRKPDVILVTIDTLRADRVGCYGDSGSATPNLDRLAREGILFDDAVTPVPITLPSHCTMLTGLIPPHHGVRNNGSYSLPPDVTTLAERFQQAGYRTGGFISAFVLHRQFGIGRGFQVYDDSLVTERSGTRTVERALRWLDSGAKEPVFLWVHLYEPHTPWTPPPPFLNMPLRSGYEKEVATADGALGLLLEHLRSQGKLDRAIVMVLGDHGEGLNDHGEAEHGIFLYRETTHIPWIVRLPQARDAGRRVNALVSSTDLAPTLCALAGLKPMPTTDGLSLEPALRGRPLPPRSGVYLESLLPQENYGWAPLFAYQTERWKWIRAPESELYDRSRRPMEGTNLAGSLPDTASILNRRLEALVSSASTRGAQAQSVSPEVIERLRSLGYVSAGNLAPKEKEGLPDPKRMIVVQEDLETAKRLMDYGDFGDAIPPFRRVLAANEQNVVALLGLGRALNLTGRYEEAEVIYRRTIRLRPGNTTAMTGLADALYGLGKWGEAVALYRLSGSDATQGPQMLARAAACEVMLGKADAARQLLTQAAGLYPSRRSYLADVGRQIEEYRASGAIAASSDSARLHRAVLAANLGLIAESEKLLSRPFSSPSGELRRLKLLESLYTALQRPQEALTVLSRIYGTFGHTSKREIREAKLRNDAGMQQEALAIFSRVLSDTLLSRPDLAALQYERCCALSQLGRGEDAMRALQSAEDSGYSDLRALLTDPDLDALRDDPRLLIVINEVSAACGPTSNAPRPSSGSGSEHG